MKQVPLSIAFTCALCTLTACGGGSRQATTTTPPVTQSPPNSTYIITGNWQFSAVSSVAGKPALSIGGSISQSGTAATTALHVEGSGCFDQLAILSLTGTVTNNVTTLTSAAVNGQVVTLTGNFTYTTFTGTYSVSGGCDAGDQGSVTGINISLGNADGWEGTFTSSAQKTFTATGNFAESTDPSSEGSLGVTGTATFNTPCFTPQNLNAGSFPSGSYVLGTLVSLEVDTNNGTLDFVGTEDTVSGLISGTYSVTGGTCAQTGTAALDLTGWWDY